MKIKGVDVSYCQQGLNYEKVKAAGVKFAIIRAGFSQKQDNLLEYHIRGCKSVGIDYGFYWYCYADSVEGAVKEAQKCLEVISKYGRPTYPVFFDMEENSQAKLGKRVCTDMALAFCTTIEEGGYPCGIYANPSWLESFYYKNELVGKYDIWLAHWTESPDRPSRYDYGQTIHQWGLDHIGMDIDGNVCYIDYPAKTAEWYKKHGIISENTVPETKAPTVSAPAKDSATLHKGDKVILRSAPLYISSTAAKKSNTVSGEYYVHSDGVICDRIRITNRKGNSVCTGWVDVSCCTKNSTVVFSVGDTVCVRKGAKTYDGSNLAGFVYSQEYTVMQVGTRGAPDYIVIGKGGAVTAAVKAADLMKV